MREMKDSGIEWIGEIPSDWKLERSQWHLEEVNISNNPIQTNNVLSLTNKLGVVPYEEKGNQGNKSKENVYEYKLAYPNTIVANSMNILIGSVGLCDYFGCVSPVYYVFRAKKYLANAGNKTVFSKDELSGIYRSSNVVMIEMVYNGFFDKGHNITYWQLKNKELFESHPYNIDYSMNEMIEILKLGGKDVGNIIIDKT